MKALGISNQQMMDFRTNFSIFEALMPTSSLASNNLVKLSATTIKNWYWLVLDMGTFPSWSISHYANSMELMIGINSVATVWEMEENSWHLWHFVTRSMHHGASWTNSCHTFLYESPGGPILLFWASSIVEKGACWFCHWLSEEFPLMHEKFCTSFNFLASMGSSSSFLVSKKLL